MNEQQQDFLKIKKIIGKVTPEQLGSLMRQYYTKHLSGVPIANNYLEEAVGLFAKPLNTIDNLDNRGKMQP
jgi:hypothetical protein